MAKDTTEIFNKFAGREVPMVETHKTFNSFGETYARDVVQLANQNDPTLQEMLKVAKDNGLSLRFSWPTHRMGTDDVRFDRVNVHIGKEADGKYRICKKFKVG